MRKGKERTRNKPSQEPVVLIVHSDPSTRDWIEASVASAGLRVLSFDSAQALLSQVSHDSASCAIVEVTQADAAGFGLHLELARAGAPFVVVTNEQSIAACVRAFKAGAVDFLSLPCEAMDLVRALRDALGEAIRNWHHRRQLSALKAAYARLTFRERQVFTLVTRGLLNKQIARVLNISEITVQVHRRRAKRKLGARSVAALVRMADQLQLDEVTDVYACRVAKPSDEHS